MIGNIANQAVLLQAIDREFFKGSPQRKKPTRFLVGSVNVDVKRKSDCSI